jgi:hypothetical protein
MTACPGTGVELKVEVSETPTDPEALTACLAVAPYRCARNAAY